MFVDSVVTRPTIGTNNGARDDRVADEWRQAGSRYVRYTAKPDSTESLWRMDFYSDGNDCLLVSFTPVYASFLAANIRLIHFNGTVKAISPGPDHGSPHLVQPRPCRLVASEPDGTLETKCVPSILLAGYVPHRLEPSTERLPCTFENGSRSHGRLTTTRGAEHLFSCCHPGMVAPAGRAIESIGPAESFKIGQTSGFRGKPLVEFLERPWVVHAAHRVGSYFVHHYILYQLERNGYPL